MYLLCPTHPVGKGKLKKWQGAFGIGKGDGELLERLIRTQILTASIRENPVKPMPENPERLIRSWTVVMSAFEGPNGNVANVETAWALDPDEDSPHFVTGYPKKVAGEQTLAKGT